MACCKEGCEDSVCQYGELQSGEVIKPESCMPMNRVDDLKKKGAAGPLAGHSSKACM